MKGLDRLRRRGEPERPRPDAGRRSRLRDWRLRLELQLGSRFLLFAVIDGVLVGGAILAALLGGGEPRDFYFQAVLLAPLLVGLPALADLLALERNAGSLDLALATPAPVAYFVRRVQAVSAVLVAQSTLTLLAIWISEKGGFPLVPPLLSSLAGNALLAAAVLFWAGRVETAGAVWFASMCSLLALGKWFFANPIPLRNGEEPSPFFASPAATLAWLGNLAVVLAATLILYLYARRRLAQPERLLT
jgi:hypothetical protein